MTIDVPALLLQHHGSPPPHHVEVDVADGCYRGVQIRGKRGIAVGPQIGKLARAFGNGFRCLAPVASPKATEPSQATPVAPAEVTEGADAAPAHAKPAQGNVGAPVRAEATKVRRVAQKGPMATDDDDDW